MQSISRRIVGTVCFCTLGFGAFAANNDWTNSAGGSWEDTTSWSQGSLPDPTDTVRFAGSGAYTVEVGNAAANTAPTSFTNSGMEVGFNGGSGVPTVNFTYTNPISFQVNGTLGIGAPSGIATVNWNAPNATNSMTSFLMNWGTIPQTGTQSVLNVKGGTFLVNGQFFMASEPGQLATVNLTTGGVFRFSSGQNRIGGSGGTGQFNINGGTMDWIGNAFLGYAIGSTGRVVITSGDLLFFQPGSNSQIDIGSGGSQSAANGYGQLILSNGNVAGNGFITVGSGPRSRGEFLMYGGTVTNQGRPLTVGGGGSISYPADQQGSATGLVLIAGGDWIQGAGMSVGALSNSLGIVTVSNGTVRLRFTNGHLVLGSGAHGRGELNMAGGTMLFSENSTGGGFDNGLIIGLGDNSVGRLHVTGGRMNMTGFGPGFVIGSNATSQASMILDGGRVELQRLSVGPTGVLSNRTGGLLQFLGGDIVSGPTSNLIVDGGTLSYKDYSGLNVTGAVSKFNVVSGSGLQLDTSTNVNIAGTFTLTNSAGNFKELSLTGNGTLWQSDNLLITDGSRLHVTNASNARLASVVNNDGIIFVQDSTVTFQRELTVAGRYVSDPSTNTFSSNVTVSVSGTLEGGAGDLFDFKKNLTINSTNRFGFDLGLSTVQFSGGGMHTNAITGRDLGTNGAGFADNFAYGSLRLGSATDQVCFACGNIPLEPSNGLYITFLDLQGNASWVTNLHAPTNITLYYLSSEHDTRNAYLGDLTYQLTDCNGALGGFLMPAVPEPSALVLVLAGTIAGLRSRRSRNRHPGS